MDYWSYRHIYIRLHTALKVWFVLKWIILFFVVQVCRNYLYNYDILWIGLIFRFMEALYFLVSHYECNGKSTVSVFLRSNCHIKYSRQLLSHFKFWINSLGISASYTTVILWLLKLQERVLRWYCPILGYQFFIFTDFLKLVLAINPTSWHQYLSLSFQVNNLVGLSFFTRRYNLQTWLRFWQTFGNIFRWFF